MSEVKRYIFDSLLGMMVENADGEYRRNSDYEALERENAELKEVLADNRRLVRDLDVIWNGVDGAAPQASMCDLVAQIRKELPGMTERLALRQREDWPLTSSPFSPKVT